MQINFPVAEDSWSPRPGDEYGSISNIVPILLFTLNIGRYWLVTAYSNIWWSVNNNNKAPILPPSLLFIQGSLHFTALTSTSNLTRI